MKIFSTAALLCAVSFTPSQASDGTNPYGINQERERNNRFIRVITEIPVGMLDSDVSHRGRCEYAGLPSASECIVPKKAGPQSPIESLLATSGGKCSTDTPFAASVLKLLIELTKSLKVAPSAGDSLSIPAKPSFLGDPEYGPASAVFGVGGRTVPVEVTKARETAARLIEEAKKAKRAETLVAKKAAMDAVIALNNAAAEAVKAKQPPFVYEDPILTGRIEVFAKKKFEALKSRKDTTAIKNLLDTTVNFAINTDAAIHPFSTDIAIANTLLSELRKAGAEFGDIRTYLQTNPLSITPAIRAIALAAFTD